MTARALRAYVVDDEPLAVKRLVALLRRTGRVELAGSATDPAEAIRALSEAPDEVDVLFLDIHMPEVDGFALLERLPRPPVVVFTTAHDEHALRAFQVLAIDYLLKPIRADDLSRALDKLDRLAAAAAAPGRAPALGALLDLVRGARATARIASRLGDRVTLLDLDRISHFHAADRLTYAVCDGRDHIIDETLAALERRLDPDAFFRIHRNTIVNLALIAELISDSGALFVRLRGAAAGPPLPVSRDRVRPLKDKLGV
jgi:two-component system LytT family response regulator